jgi:hypothetical protein
MICPTLKAKYFSPKEWTVESALMLLAKFDFWRNRLGRTEHHARIMI